MTNPLGTVDFFALEAGEALDRIAALVAREGGPPADEFLRTVRLLRGSALLAQQQAIARAAAGLEAVARGHREARLGWSRELGERLVAAVQEFRALVSRAHGWTADDSASAARLASRLSGLAGEEPGPVGRAAAVPPTAEAGVRAFVARETAAIAGELEAAAGALRESPGQRGPLDAVIRRIRSLRGLADLGDLNPIPEILDGVELAVGDLTYLDAPPPRADEVIAAAAPALARAAREVADPGRPDPEAPEARRFARDLLGAFALESDVVPIESLYPGDRFDPVAAPAANARFASAEPLGALQLVGHGEHLCQAAELISRASSDVERDLRLYRLLGTLRATATAGSDPVAAALRALSRAAREAVAARSAGADGADTEALVDALREAGDLLRRAADLNDPTLVAGGLLDAARRLDEGRAGPAGAARPAVGTGSPGRSEHRQDDVVPIRDLVAGPPLTAAAHVAEVGPAVPIQSLLSRPEAPPPAGTPESGVGDTPVEIDSLCYRGPAALRRADEVRRELARELATATSLDGIRPLLQELIDLVPLALAER